MTADAAVARARQHAARGEDAAAKQAYVDALRLDQTHFAALNELAALASETGHRSAARAACAASVRHHPRNPVGRVNLGTLLFEAGDLPGAREQFQAALAVDAGFAEAHQGLARLLAEARDPAAEFHFKKGFSGRAIARAPRRRAGGPLLLLVCARGGNIPTGSWIDDRRFAITAIHPEFLDPAEPLPPHALVVNAIGDADLCDAALARAEQLVARVAAPVINPPARVRATGRAANARRLANMPGVIAPGIKPLSREQMLAADLPFPLLLRSPGFHTGRHFVRVPDRNALAEAIALLPGGELLAIECLDARGPDGFYRKYRVMFIDGGLHPLHLAISPGWKVHYFSAAMADSAAHREEERRFLEDMPGVLGERAMRALRGVAAMLALDYAGVDFALAPDGSLLLFEANATMVVHPPDPDPMWDYRRAAVAAVLDAAKRMLNRGAALAPPARAPG